MNDREGQNLKMCMSVFIVMPTMAYGIVRLLFRLM